MFKIIFPQNTGQRYWQIHYLYVQQIFNYLNCDISLEPREDFIVTINGKDFLFDFWDKSELRESKLPTFKFHAHKDTKAIPFAPVSFYAWDAYYKLFEPKIQYKAKGAISSRQIPYAGALERRNHVQQLLRAHLGNELRTDFIPQEKFWLEINDILLAVCVPGYCNNMLDRGQFQYMAFGCPTISPNIPEVLPFGRTLVPGVHYIVCKDDYSDLIEVLDWFRAHPDELLNIGRQAKSLFQKTSTPAKIGEWIRMHL